MYTHILYPTDLSDNANDGFSTAVELARLFDARITLLNIHEEFLNEQEMQSLRVSAEGYREMMKSRALASREQMRELVEREDAQSFTDVIMRAGMPKPEIISTAQDVGADLIVMTSNGRSNLSQLLLGSVAEYVVRTSPVPVLVIKVPR